MEDKKSKRDKTVAFMYKPFRNNLRKFNVMDALYVIWGYSRSYKMKLPIPSDIEVPKDFYPTTDIHKRIQYGIWEHEKEFLLKEIFINCDSNTSIYTLKTRKHLADLMNNLRLLNNRIDRLYFQEETGLLELNRIAHNQFHWQDAFTRHTMFRYYKIYSHPEINDLIQANLGMGIFELTVIGYIFYSNTNKDFRILLPIKSEIPAITNEMIELYLKRFSITLEEAKEKVKEYQEMNKNIFYSFNPLVEKPILIVDNTYLAPIPFLIYEQVTSGIYYLLVGDSKFKNPYGKSFENYIGEVLSKAITKSEFRITPEITYGKPEKHSSDWIVSDKQSIMFIECKTKKMTLGSKLNIDIKKGLESDTEKMAGFILQLYKCYLEYKDNKYVSLPYDPNKLFVPIVLTLEDWYVSFNPLLKEMITKALVSKFKENEMDLSLILKFPFYIFSSAVFEDDVQVINEIGIKTYFDKLQANTIHEYNQTFKYRNLFEGEFETIFRKPLLKLK